MIGSGKEEEEGMVATVDRRFDVALEEYNPTQRQANREDRKVRTMQYRPDILALKKNLKEAHRRLSAQVSASTLCVIEGLHYPILSEVHFLMGDTEKGKYYFPF